MSPARYAGPGFSFRYPADWLVEDDRGPEELTVTVRPDESATAFWSLTLLNDRPDAAETLATVIAAFVEEYADLDLYQVEQTIARRPAIGRDLEFVCLELLNSAFARAFETDRFTVLLLSQATDTELRQYRESFDLMTSSLECDLESVLGGP